MTRIDFGAILPFLDQYRYLVEWFLAGIIALLVARKIGVRRIAVTAAVGVGFVTSVESAWMFAGDKLALEGIARAFPAVLFESAAVAYAKRAHDYYNSIDDKGKQRKTLGPYITRVWLLAIMAGVTMGISSANLGQGVYRFLIPIVAVMIWHGDYLLTDIQEGRTTWLWTPRRLGIKLGMIRPGEQDLKAAHRDFVIDALVRTAYRYHRGGLLPHWWYSARLRGHAFDANEKIMAEVQTRLARVYSIAELTAPVTDKTTATDTATETVTMPDIQAAIETAIEAARGPVKRAAKQAATSAPARLPRHRQRDGRATAKRVAKEAANARAKLADALREQPNATARELAILADVSVRTAERHVPGLRTATTTATEPATDTASQSATDRHRANGVAVAN